MSIHSHPLKINSIRTRAAGASVESKAQGDGTAGFIRKRIANTTVIRSPSERLGRRVVVWCVLDGRPWAEVHNLGLKTLLADLAPEFVAAAPSSQVLDVILFTLYAEVKESVLGILRVLHDRCEKVGYAGAFCNLQLDVAAVSGQEICTASVSFLGTFSAEVERVSLASKVFPGSHKEADVVEWIENVSIPIPHYCTTPREYDVTLNCTVLYYCS